MEQINNFIAKVNQTTFNSLILITVEHKYISYKNNKRSSRKGYSCLLMYAAYTVHCILGCSDSDLFRENRKD
jgi:hypothetical protein